MWSNWGSHPLLEGMQRDTATLENKLAASYQFILTKSSSNCTLEYLPKRNKNLFFILSLHRDMYSNVHSSFIHKNKKLETRCKCPSTVEWVNQLWYIYAIEYNPARKGNKPFILATTWMNLKGIVLSERSQAKIDGILYNFIYRNF